MSLSRPRGSVSQHTGIVPFQDLMNRVLYGVTVQFSCRVLLHFVELEDLLFESRAFDLGSSDLCEGYSGGRTGQEVAAVCLLQTHTYSERRQSHSLT